MLVLNPFATVRAAWRPHKSLWKGAGENLSAERFSPGDTPTRWFRLEQIPPSAYNCRHRSSRFFPRRMGQRHPMLAELRITNFALIDHAEVELAEGFNVLTGATGVGKSLVIDALELLLGGRASAELIRHGEDEAAVEGTFLAPGAPLREAIARLAGVDALPEPEVILHRTISRAGRNRCRLGPWAINVATLREIGSLLVDIHGQHEQQSLLYADKQRDLLDEFGRLGEHRERFAAALAEHRRKQKHLDELQATERQRRAELDICRFQLDEIDRAAVRPGEFEAIERERTLLANAEKILSRVAEGYNLLYEGDGSVLDRLKSLARQLGEIACLDARLKDVLDACSDASARLEDASLTLRNYRDRWEFDPARLEEVEQRLVQLRKLQAKYGGSEADIAAFADGLRGKIADLAAADEDLRSLAAGLKASAEAALQAGALLSAGRRKAAARLAKSVEQELQSLGMDKTRFEVAVAPCLSLEQAAASGMDDVEFLIAPNPGEPPMSLRRIASGGEISRVMLALKTVLADADRVPLLIFDEVDANVGGRMGRLIGERLAAIARCHQVVCVTHLPQLAACAGHHLRVSKQVRKGQTFTLVEELHGDARLQEIAEMIGGKDRTRTTLEQAREMLGDRL